MPRSLFFLLDQPLWDHLSQFSSPGISGPLSSPWRSARAYLRVLIIVSRFHHWEGRLSDPLFQECPRQCWTPQVPNKEAREEAPFLELSP